MKTLTLTPAAAQLLAMMLEDHADALERALKRRFSWPRMVRQKDVFYAEELALIQGLIKQLMTDEQSKGKNEQENRSG